MKKMVLSLFGLLTVSLAAAQSYAKQPDPATYEVVEYKPSKQAPAETHPEATQPETTANESAPQAQKAENNNNTATPAQAPQPVTVAEKEIQNRKRK